MRIVRFACIAGVLALSGCAPKLFQWGSYEADLLKYYKHPESLPDFLAHLEKQVTDTVEKGKKVPPGLFAELGYLYYKSGDSQKALDCFEKEKASWPESERLMERMILAAQSQERHLEG